MLWWQGASHQTTSSTSEEQAVLVKVDVSGTGSALSLTVAKIVSESEQYLTSSTVTPSGAQLAKLPEISCPLFVKGLPLHVTLLKPEAVKSSMPAPCAKLVTFTCTVSLMPPM